jgi:hypothetical protein
VGEVEGIKQGLDIKGMRTFKFKLEDDNGKMHEIKILNCLFIPDLKRCLLCPQHWVQEARDSYPMPKGTQMEQDDEIYILIWGKAKYKKLISYNSSSNVPISYRASLSCAYCAFTTTFKVLKANFFRREKVLQFPGRRLTIDEPNFVPEEFVAEENVNYCKDVSASDGVNSDGKTIKTSNLPLPPQDEEPAKVI